MDRKVGDGAEGEHDELAGGKTLLDGGKTLLDVTIPAELRAIADEDTLDSVPTKVNLKPPRARDSEESVARALLAQAPPNLGAAPVGVSRPHNAPTVVMPRFPATLIDLHPPTEMQHEVDAAPITVRKPPSSGAVPSAPILPPPNALSSQPLRLPELTPEAEPPVEPEPAVAPSPPPPAQRDPRAYPPLTPVPTAPKRRGGDVRFFSHDDEGRWLDRYELICEIASGGMATVFLGRLQGAGGFQRLVAIKRLHSNLAEDPSFVEMFLAEARIAAQIHHTHAVPILEIGSSDRGYYLVMEYIEGVTLAQLNQRVALSELPVPRRIALRIVLDALAGLHAAHELTDDDGKLLGIVHRDCSPQNIIVGVDGTARLMDFGVARATTRRSNTQIGTLKGKVAYMAPEQIKQGKLDRRADLFAMGVILWECLAGRTLFRADSKLDTILAALNAPVPRLSEVTFGVPPELEEVCVKALARAADERFQTAVEMAEAIEQAGRASIATSREVASFLLKMFGRDFNERRTTIRAWIEDGALKQPPGGQRATTPRPERPASAAPPAPAAPRAEVRIPPQRPVIIDAPPESVTQTRQFVGSLLPIQLDNEEPPPAPKPAARLPVDGPPLPRPVLFSSMGAPAAEGRSLLRPALWVGAILVIGAIGAFLLLGPAGRPSAPPPPTGSAAPAVSSPPAPTPAPPETTAPTTATTEASAQMPAASSSAFRPHPAGSQPRKPPTPPEEINPYR